MKNRRNTKQKPSPDNKDKEKAPENKAVFRPGAHVTADLPPRAAAPSQLATYLIPASETAVTELCDGNDHVTLTRGHIAYITTGKLLRTTGGVMGEIKAPALPGTPPDTFCVIPLPDQGDKPLDDGTSLFELSPDAGISLVYAPARTEIQSLSLLTAYTGYVISGSVYAREEAEPHDIRPKVKLNPGDAIISTSHRRFLLSTQDDDCRLLIFEKTDRIKP